MSLSISECKKEGALYIEKFIVEDGGVKTDSGLAYKILSVGQGKSPSASDTVEVHYEGTLIDGKVFDSSYERNAKISFPLNRVIKGWTEGLQLIKEGGKVQLVIPSELAYGDRGAPPVIPGGATLVFMVELFKVK
ncbi:MAG: FKBP-type peptidyl-prolyl cis-trans isomerase [Oligoflexia bacterium]|nr:FKBP-type peptidyl-prolyl cis-trans isomerase [Oligoflexia bacterium]